MWTTTIRLELTESQKAQIRAATGREVSVLELRLHALPEAAAIKPVSNKVPDSQEPPDHWASTYTPDKIGPYPLPVYPSSNEEFKP